MLCKEAGVAVASCADDSPGTTDVTMTLGAVETAEEATDRVGGSIVSNERYGERCWC